MSGHRQCLCQGSTSPLDLQDELLPLPPHRDIVDPSTEVRVGDSDAHLVCGVPRDTAGRGAGDQEPEEHPERGDAQDDESGDDGILEGEAKQEGEDGEQEDEDDPADHGTRSSQAAKHAAGRNQAERSHARVENLQRSWVLFALPLREEEVLSDHQLSREAAMGTTRFLAEYGRGRRHPLRRVVGLRATGRLLEVALAARASRSGRTAFEPGGRDDVVDPK